MIRAAEMMLGEARQLEDGGWSSAELTDDRSMQSGDYTVLLIATLFLECCDQATVGQGNILRFLLLDPRLRPNQQELLMCSAPITSMLRW